MDKNHKHKWQTQQVLDTIHREPDKNLTYRFIQVCECGAYRVEEFKHISDIKKDD